MEESPVIGYEPEDVADSNEMFVDGERPDVEAEPQGEVLEDDQMSSLFVVVLFRERKEVELVPAEWLQVERMESRQLGLCWWPPFKAAAKCKTRAAVDHNSWMKFSCMILGFFETYEEGMAKAKVAEEIMGFETDGNEGSELSKKYNKSRFKEDADVEHKRENATEDETDQRGLALQEESSDGRKQQCSCDTDLKALISRGFSEIKQKLDEVMEGQRDIVARLDRLESVSSKPRNIKEDPVVELCDVQFPLENMEAVRRLEEKLQSTKSRNDLMVYLRKFRGDGVRSMTLHILRHVFSDKVAQQFSWFGFKQKEVFSNLILCRVILDIVLVCNTKASENEVSSHVKTWLRNAKGRRMYKSTKW